VQGAAVDVEILVDAVETVKVAALDAQEAALAVLAALVVQEAAVELALEVALVAQEVVQELVVELVMQLVQMIVLVVAKPDVQAHAQELALLNVLVVHKILMLQICL
jgi:hypothetical protein